jgi:hypothetical protein
MFRSDKAVIKGNRNYNNRTRLRITYLGNVQIDSNIKFTQDRQYTFNLTVTHVHIPVVAIKNQEV